jgi:hypothetical protein
MIKGTCLAAPQRKTGIPQKLGLEIPQKLGLEIPQKLGLEIPQRKAPAQHFLT